MKEIVFATNNKYKIKEVKNILNNDIKLLSLKDVNVDFDVEETGETFLENAILKAKEYYKLCNRPVLAEDSGLCIDYLNGLPGVYSKRFYYGLTEEEGNIKVLNLMKDADNRDAYYIAVYVYFDGENLVVSEDTVDGLITHNISGTNGFSYDKIFYSKDLKKKMSEATLDEKNSVSHRKKALDRLKLKLKNENLL